MTVVNLMDHLQSCREMFAQHRVEAFGGAIHVPASREYSCVFAWDSGYHALALRHIDRAAALEELSTLYAANLNDDGMLAHERPLPGAEARTKLVTEWLGPIYRPDGRSWLIDPPVAAYAVGTIFDPAIDSDLTLLSQATDHLASIDQLRTLAPGGAPVILHPLESGADVSPLFDALVDTGSRRALLTCHRGLSVGLEVGAYDVSHARDNGHPFIVSDPIFCGWHLLALEALADAWRRAGVAETAEQLDLRAQQLADEMMRLMWSERHHLFVGHDHVAGAQLDVATLGGIIAAASRTMIARGVGAAVADAHLQPDTSRFWGPAGVAFNPLNGLEIDPKALLWRGDVIWGATQFWAHLVLSRLGRAEPARLALSQMVDLIARSGFREFYSAATGQGYGAGETEGFTWPALILEMSAQAEQTR